MDYILCVQRCPRKDYNILTDSAYCVRLFADNSIKGHSNKALIAKVRRVLSQVKLRYNLSIGWTKAHTGLLTPKTLGIAAPDCQAARGRTGSTSPAVMGPANLPLARVSRPTSTYGSMPRHGSRRCRPPSARDPRRRDTIVYALLSSAQRTVLVRLAGIYRTSNAMLSPPSPPPSGSGDIVGD